MKLFKKRSYAELLAKYNKVLTDDTVLKEERQKLDLLTALIKPEVDKAKELDTVDFTVDVTDVKTMEYDYLGIIMGKLESPYVYCKYFKLKGRLYLTCAKEKSKAYKRLQHLEYWALLVSLPIALAVSPLVHWITLLFLKDSYDPSVENPFLKSADSLVNWSQLNTYLTTKGFVPAFTFFGSLAIAMLLILLFIQYSSVSPYNKNVLRWSDISSN